MFSLAGGGLEITKDTHQVIVAELTIIGFFYAMRSCEMTHTPQDGRTKVIRLRGVKFRDKENNVVPHSSPDLARAEWVTVTFENQKNGMKMVNRTHQRSGDSVLCPVLRLASVVERIYRRVPNASPDTSIDAIYLLTRASRVTSTDIRSSIRTTCTLAGGEKTFSFTAADLGTRSIRSGAAMALFLMNHTVAKIMMMGRWSSDAFLDYIRPQVLEWMNQMSGDMIHHDSYFDTTDPSRMKPDDPQTRSKRLRGGQESGHTRLHLHH